MFVQSQDAIVKDTLEKATEPNLNLKAYLEDAYVHPIFKGDEFESSADIDDEENNPVVATKRNSRMGSKYGSNESSPRFSSKWSQITIDSLFTLYYRL